MHIFISKQAVVSRKAQKKQHVYVSSGLHDHYSELFYMDGRFKNLNNITKPTGPKSNFLLFIPTGNLDDSWA